MLKVAFSDLSDALRWRKRLARRARILIKCSVNESSHGDVTITVDKRPHFVGATSLSVIGGNFVLAKVYVGG